jgi:hypothetical protein
MKAYGVEAMVSHSGSLLLEKEPSIPIGKEAR